MYLASVVNLGMIWCFVFFFLELLDDCDEKSNNDDALASLDDADRKLGSDSDRGLKDFVNAVIIYSPVTVGPDNCET